MIARLFNALGSGILSFFQYLGEVVLLAADTFRSIFTHKLRWKLFLSQIVEIGLRSQSVVVITGGFTGAVFTAQTYFQFNKLGMGSAVGAVVSVAICRELGPVLTALMVSGRVGAAMSAEIGTMKVTEPNATHWSMSVTPPSPKSNSKPESRTTGSPSWRKRSATFRPTGPWSPKF